MSATPSTYTEEVDETGPGTPCPSEPGGCRRGRPSKYSDKLAWELCDWLLEGGSLRAFCARPDYPDKRTVLRWLEHNETFRGRYTRARELQAELLLEEILDIADDPRHDWIERTTKGGETIVVADHDHINRSRLRVDARKWMLARMSPRKYSERALLEVTGANGGPISFAELARQARREP